MTEIEKILLQELEDVRNERDIFQKAMKSTSKRIESLKSDLQIVLNLLHSSKDFLPKNKENIEEIKLTTQTLQEVEWIKQREKIISKINYL